MPLLSTASENSSLDNDYGVPSYRPTAHQVALFIGDPANDGIEVPTTTETEAGTVPNGYERVTIANDGTIWLPAADGQKSTAAVVQFPDALAEYPGTVTHFVLYDDADGTTPWEGAPLLEPLDVTEAGDGPAGVLTIFYSTDPLTEE